jgi:hypothetical protein
MRGVVRRWNADLIPASQALGGKSNGPDGFGWIRCDGESQDVQICEADLPHCRRHAPGSRIGLTLEFSVMNSKATECMLIVGPFWR